MFAREDWCEDDGKDGNLLHRVNEKTKQYIYLTN